MALQAATSLISSGDETWTSSEQHLHKQNWGFTLAGVALLVFGVGMCSCLLHGEGATSPGLSWVPALHMGVDTASGPGCPAWGSAQSRNPSTKPHNFMQTKFPWRTKGSPEASQEEEEEDCWGPHLAFAILLPISVIRSPPLPSQGCAVGTG